jgi:hypothetical protein
MLVKSHPGFWFSKLDSPAGRVSPWVGLAVALAWAPPASARILKTRSANGQAGLLVGSGFEFESDGSSTEYGVPLLAEWSPFEPFKIGLEPTFVFVQDAGKPLVAGFGETELAFTYEFVTERRVRPSFSFEQVAKLPTAVPDSLGTGEPDVSLGLIVDKDLVWFDVELNTVYTFIGSPTGDNLHNTVEVGLAADIPLNWFLDVEVEGVVSTGRLSGAGGSGGIGGFRSGTAAEEGGSEAEGTVGIAEALTRHLKIEEGVNFKADGAWQVVAAWEYDFGEGD